MVVERADLGQPARFSRQDSSVGSSSRPPGMRRDNTGRAAKSARTPGHTGDSPGSVLSFGQGVGPLRQQVSAGYADRSLRPLSWPQPREDAILGLWSCSDSRSPHLIHISDDYINFSSALVFGHRYTSGVPSSPTDRMPPQGHEGIWVSSSLRGVSVNMAVQV